MEYQSPLSKDKGFDTLRVGFEHKLPLQEKSARKRSRRGAVGSLFRKGDVFSMIGLVSSVASLGALLGYGIYRLRKISKDGAELSQGSAVQGAAHTRTNGHPEAQQVMRERVAEMTRSYNRSNTSSSFDSRDAEKMA